MRLVLIGTVGSTHVALKVMFDLGSPPIHLFTLDSSKSLRHSDYIDLKPHAKQCHVPVTEITNINASNTIEALSSLNPDYIFVIGWSQICSKELLMIPKQGAIGFHPSFLPENRGRAVIPWTILQRKRETGSTLFWIDEGTDSGDVLAQERFLVCTDEIATTLYQKHEDCLKRLLINYIPKIIDGTAPRSPQVHSHATYCAKRTPADGAIDWTASAESVWTLVRATTCPYPGAFTFYRGEKVIFWEANFVGDAPYFGLQGQIQRVSDEDVLIQCGDRRHISVKKVQTENGMQVLSKEYFKLHDRLGF